MEKTYRAVRHDITRANNSRKDSFMRIMPLERSRVNIKYRLEKCLAFCVACGKRKSNRIYGS